MPCESLVVIPWFSFADDLKSMQNVEVWGQKWTWGGSEVRSLPPNHMVPGESVSQRCALGKYLHTVALR